MGLDDFLISTGVDGLIKLVHDRGKIEAKDAARELGIPLSTVEDWAKTLEAESLIRIEYNLTKEFLVWTSMNTAQYQQTKGEIGKEREATMQKLEGLKKAVDQNVEEITKVEGEFGAMNQKTIDALGKIGGDLHEAQRLAMQADQTITQKKQNLQALKAELDEARQSFESLKSVMKKGGSVKGAKDTQALMKELEEASASLEKKLQNTANEFEKINERIENIRGQLVSNKSVQEVNLVQKDIEDLKFARTELLKTAKALLLEVKEMGERIGGMETKLSELETQKKIKADPQKLAAEIDELQKKAVAGSREIVDELQGKLMSIRKEAMNYSQAAYQYQNATAHLNNVQSQYSSESAELDKMISVLDAAKDKYAHDLEETKQALGSQKDKFEELASRAKRIEIMLTNINDLKNEGKTLSTKLKGLMMEAQVVDMAAPAGTPIPGRQQVIGSSKVRQNANRASGAIPEASGAYGSLPPELVQKITMTESEEKAFEKKREELRWLIQKMWEDDRKAAGA